MLTVVKTSASKRIGTRNIAHVKELRLSTYFCEMTKNDTVAPRNTGRQGTTKSHLLLADFCYCRYNKLKELT